MNVLICIGIVPDTTSKIRFIENDTKFNKSDIQYIVGPYEELALTRLLEIKDSGIPMNITVVNVGTSDSDPVIRKTLAVGADEAIRIDADPTDALFVAKQIAEVYKSGSYDFIVTGKESIDYNGGQIDGMIAEFLDLPSISGAAKIEIIGNNAKIEREIDGGKEVVEVTFPFVTSAQKGFALEPRIAGMRGIMDAKKKKLTVVSAVEQTNSTQISKHFLPAAKAACKIISSDNVGELVRLLHEEAKII